MIDEKKLLIEQYHKAYEHTSVLKIYKHYGKDKQLRQTQEECAELIVAINKLFRNNQDSISFNKANNNFLEEVADVEIMLLQCKIILQEDGKSEEYRDALVKKLERQLERMRGQENETKGLCSGD